MNNQKHAGILLSYLNTVINMCFNLLLVPLLITALTDAQYGIYKVIQSFASPLLMLNLGMSTVVTRCIAKYQIRQEDQAREEKENTFALAVGISVAMAGIVYVAGYLMTGLLPVIFAKTYSAEEIELAGRLLRIFVCTIALHIVSDTFRGCILGRERFIVYYGTITLHYVIRFAVIIALIFWTNIDAVSVATVDLVIYAGLLLINVLYTVVCLREKIRFHAIRKTEVLSILSFCSAVLLQGIVNQVNNNLDNVILGSMLLDKRIITMYSSALSIFGIYNTMLSVLVNIYFPQTAKLVAEGYDGEKLTDFAIGPGRFQAVVALGVLCAFGLLGGNFVRIWIGVEYLEAWPVALALMIPATIPLVQNICIAILNAKLMQTFRSLVLFGMAALNVLISVFLVKIIGFWGAVIGTVVSLFVGHGILMNLYYHKVLGLNVIRLFREIFRGILPSGLISVVACLPLALCLEDNWIGFLLKCIGFAGVYSTMLWKFGLRKKEKEIVVAFLKKS